MPEVTIRRYGDFGLALRELEPWLRKREAEFGLIIGILRQLASGKHLYEPPFFVAGVEVDGELVGCAYRTPPFKLGITDLPSVAMEPLAGALREVYSGLPAVLGPQDAAVRFGFAWSRVCDCEPAVGMRQGLYRIDEVTLPDRMPPGALEPADEADWETLVAWTTEFVHESGLEPVNYDKRVRLLLDQGSLFVWRSEGVLRAMAGWMAPTGRGIRVGHVYTPPSERGRGYATAATGELTRRLLQEYDFCTLYTDLSNPTSNGVYRRLGYRQIAEAIDVNFLPPRKT